MKGKGGGSEEPWIVVRGSGIGKAGARGRRSGAREVKTGSQGSEARI